MIIHWILPTFLRDLNRDGPHPARELQLPHLSSLLRKSDVSKGESAWQVCAQLLNLPRFPFAQVLAVKNNFSADKHWLLLTPTAIQPEHRGIYLLGEKPLQMTTDERHQLQQELNAWLQEDRLQLQASTSEHWLLSIDRNTDLHTMPFWQVIGRDAMMAMPTGRDALFWQAKLTEWQMFLQRTSFNQQRQQQQKLPVQALHLWGESTAQLPHSTRIKTVLTDNDAIAQWLQKCSGGINVLPLSSLHDCHDDEVMVIAAQAEVHWAYGDFASWRDYWQQLDQLFDKKADHRIHADNNSCYQFDSLHRWRFWRGKSYLPKEML